MKKIKPLAIGFLAERILRSQAGAQVIGSTSKGIFAITPAREVLFISYEAYRSPITVSLGKPDDDLREIEIGESIALSSGAICLVDGKVLVDCSGLQPWVAGLSNEEASTPSVIADRIMALAEGIAAEKPGIGFSPLVSSLILKKTADTPSEGENEVAGQHIARILQARETWNLPAVLMEMSAILGYGRGLTPSGDDFALGFLLAINRWGDDLGYPHAALQAIDDGLITAAEEKTTSLSQAMIRLAAGGQGDERQVAVIDGLMTGKPAIETCLGYVLQMGNSSGIDAFLGMAAAIK